MRREADLLRALMLKLEAYPADAHDVIHFPFGDAEMQVDGYTEQQVEYHLHQLVTAGLVDGEAGMGMVFRGITPAGHDFLDAVRSDTTWNKAKSGAEKAGGFTIGILFDLAKAYIRAEIGKVTGLHM